MALSNLTKVQTVGIGSNIEVVGVVTTGQFKSGTSNLHSTGVELTNLNVSGIATIGGNLSVGGVLTYEDVTNIDSIGIITARSGIRIGATGANTLINGNATGIGIGTNSPKLSLHLHQENSNATFAHFTNTTTGVNANQGVSFGLDSNEDATIYHYGSNNIRFATGGTEKVRITSGGRLLVGTSTSNISGSYSAVVSTGAAGNNGGFQAHYNAGAGGGGSVTTVNAAGGGLDFWTYTGNLGSEANYNQRLRITSDGKVGINRTDPKHALEVGGNVYITANTSTANEGAGLLFQAKTGGFNTTSNAAIKGLRVNDTSAYLVFETGGTTERLRITSDGNINVNSDGVSSPYSSFRHLSINNNLFLNANNNAGGFAGMQNNAYLNSSGSWVRVNNDHTTSIGTDDGVFYFRNAGAGTGAISWNMPVKIMASNRINIGEGNSGSALGAVHINTSTVMGTNTALWIGDNTNKRYLAINQVNNNEQFSEMKLQYNDNGTNSVLKLSNPISLAGYGTAILWQGYNDGQQGMILCQSEGANNAAATMYLNSSSGTFLQGNSSRHVTTPQQPAFLAYHYGHDINYGVGSTLPYPFTVFNTGNHYNTSNSTFTAPTAGRYLFSVNANGNYTSGAGGVPRAYWKINGSNVGNSIHLRGSDATHDGLEQRSQTVIFNLSANDTVKVVVGQNQWDLFGANSFTGYLIG